MTVLDAQAIIAFLTDEPARDEVETLLRRRVPSPAICAATVTEVLDTLLRVKGVPPAQVAGSVAPLMAEVLEVVDVTEPIATIAGELRAAHDDRKRCPISLGDALVLATAIERDDALATSDPAMLSVAVKRGVSVVPLPDQWGNRPRPRR